MAKHLSSLILVTILIAGSDVKAADAEAEFELSPAQVEKVEDLIEKRTGPDKPGFSVAISRGGNLLMSRGFGLAQLEYEVPIESDTIFHVASVSKQFVVFAIALLAADGKLDLDANVRDYIAEVPDFGHKITLRHLIHHTSGMRDQWDLFVLAGGRMDDVISTHDVLQLVSKQRDLNFEPGSEHVYCNTGYTLLGLVVERVSGMTLKDFCDQRIFQPLQMSHTHFHDDHRELVPGRAYSYTKTGKSKIQKSVLSYATVGATSLFTTAEDLLKWQQNFATHQVGSQEVFETMLHRGRLNDGTEIDYAGGLVHRTYKGLPVVSHGGADAGFRSFTCRFPDQDVAVAVLGNFASSNPGGVVFSIADVVLADEFPESKPRSTKNTDTANSEQSADPGDNNQPLTTQQLDLCGWYFDQSGPAIYVVTADDDKLFMQTGFRKPIEMRRTAPLQYESTNQRFGFVMSFGCESGDKTCAATVTLPGIDPRPLESVEPKLADTEYLSTLPGRYYSQELEAFYEIVSEQEGLFLKRRRHEPAKLRQLFRDAFSAGRFTIRLSKIDPGTIDGFQLSTGRVRNLRFDRH